MGFLRARPRFLLAALVGGFALLSPGCTRDGALPPMSLGASAIDFVVGQPRDYFLRKWGEPLPGAEDAWQLETGTLTVRFSEGRAAVLTYTLPTGEWTDEQIRSALAANGAGWRRIPGKSGASVLSEWRADLLNDFGVPHVVCFLSQEGTEARVFMSTLTISSSDVLATARN